MENSKTVCLSKTALDKDGKAAIEKENKNTDAGAGGDLPFLTQLSMSEDDDSTHSKPGWVGNEETDVPETKVKGSGAGKREDESTMTSSSCNRGNQSCNKGDPKSGSPWESTVAEWLTQSGEKNKKNVCVNITGNKTSVATAVAGNQPGRSRHDDNVDDVIMAIEGNEGRIIGKQSSIAEPVSEGTETSSLAKVDRPITESKGKKRRKQKFLRRSSR